MVYRFIALALTGGVALRYYLAHSCFSEWIANRIEISTPLNSWKRVIEGVSLHKIGISPYDSDVFHESPFVLFIIESLLKHGEVWLPYFFLLCDVFTAFIISKITKMILILSLEAQEKEMDKYAPQTSDLLLKSSLFDDLQLKAAAIYLLHPYSIVSCVAKSTIVFNNLILSLVFLFTLQGGFLCTFFIAVAIYQSLYPVVFILPAVLCYIQRSGYEMTIRNVIVFVLVFSSLIGAQLLGMLYVSAQWTGSWDFIYSTYGCILNLPDLTPNIGIFWYFFIELFEHFRLLFICIFQINVFIYVLPLSLKFRNDPAFLLLVFSCIITIFKSYPCVGDVAFYMALLPAWSHLNKFMRQSFVVGCSLLACSFLGPILWHLWIYSGSANANFYFAITLVYATAQIFFLSDITFAYLKRKYHLYNGTASIIINGQSSQIILK